MLKRCRGGRRGLLAAALALSLAGAGLSCRFPLPPGPASPMGTPADIAYARDLWSAMRAQRLVGPDAEPQTPFVGAARPHGWILELAYQNLRVRDHTGFVVVKKNYNGPGLTVAQVEADRARYLDSITVMYKREAGYDADNRNWFWAKYRPDGRLFSRRMGLMQVPLAGRILKGKTRDSNRGCLYCHSSAGGGDYIFYPYITVPGPADR